MFSFLFFCLLIGLSLSYETCQTPDNQSGFCILSKDCQTMVDYVKMLPRPIPLKTLKKLKQYQCGISNKKAKICCPTQPLISTEENLIYSDVTNHPNFKLIPQNCGHLPTVDKIVGGTKTVLFEFPWMALLSYQWKSGGDFKQGFKCGGTIITEKYILTAAHCVTNLKQKEQLKLIGVRVGEHDLRTEKDCEEDYEVETCAPPYQDLRIEEVIYHPEYNTTSHYNDIALLRVEKIDFKENIQPVCLPLNGTNRFNQTNRNVVITGWGFTEKGIPSPVLLKAEVPVVPLQNCQQKYTHNKIALYILSPNQICAGGASGKDSCGGDSGGPLHSIELLNNEPKYIQQGIVSFGPADCGRDSHPGVYTRLVSYLPWILDNINQ